MEITNEEAINVLRGQVTAYGDTLSEAEHKAFDKAIEVLERTRWRDAKTEPPEKSTKECICLSTGSKRVNIVSYSRKWGAFNALDWFDEDFVAKYRIPVAYWMPALPLPEELKEEGK